MARILVACEISGKVRDAFRVAGHDAWSCDIAAIQDNEAAKQKFPEFHHVCDASSILDDGWDALIAFPPCTYLSVSGMHWTARGLRDSKLTDQALDLVKTFMFADIKYIAIENPVGVIGTRIRKPDQTIQPYMFGHDASKRTCLWLKNLPKLKATSFVQPRIVKKGSTDLKRWSNQTDSGQNKLGPSESRAAKRAETYDGIAAAMADQWGCVIR
jgi:site-specific DNA-cytosine methylase